MCSTYPTYIECVSQVTIYLIYALSIFSVSPIPLFSWLLQPNYLLWNKIENIYYRLCIFSFNTIKFKFYFFLLWRNLFLTVYSLNLVQVLSISNLEDKQSILFTFKVIYKSQVKWNRGQAIYPLWASVSSIIKLGY